MKIEHIAIWSEDIEKLKDFYVKYFNAHCNKKYINDKKAFQSYFLSFDSGARLEIMKKPNLRGKCDDVSIGLAHLAISVGSREAVDELTQRIGHDGYAILSNPRTTGDGYYESIVSDTDGNIIEITL